MIRHLTLSLALLSPAPLAAQSVTPDILTTLMPQAPPGWTAQPAPEVEQIFAAQGDAVAARAYRSNEVRLLMVFTHGGPLIEIWADGLTATTAPNPNSIRSEFRGYPMQREADMITLLVGETLIQATGEGGDAVTTAMMPLFEALDLDAISTLAAHR